MNHSPQLKSFFFTIDHGHASPCPIKTELLLLPVIRCLAPSFFFLSTTLSAAAPASTSNSLLLIATTRWSIYARLAMCSQRGDATRRALETSRPHRLNQRQTRRTGEQDTLSLIRIIPPTAKRGAE